ncbi:hypothetical protein DPX16_23634 [Anabarilius grahami]|uniref:Uncharacterized protein n=1 Tax=Anabarilius grahami TaxID=495550 RepID=A0A3N0ZB14_ANAGA|nr:hypothetical protein DPX16_23634 [Anabarilius grahami]
MASCAQALPPSTYTGSPQPQVFFSITCPAQLQFFIITDGSEQFHVSIDANGPTQPPIPSSSKIDPCQRHLAAGYQGEVLRGPGSPKSTPISGRPTHATLTLSLSLFYS